MIVHRSILTLGLLGALWLAPAAAQEQPSWYPNQYELFGSVAEIDHGSGTLVIDEQPLGFSPALRVRTTHGVQTARSLRRGMRVGITSLDPDRPVQEIWVMPQAAQ
ncbi:MAG: hypothetical protein RBT81_07600 [Gammaproteobacteria bacterium]|jgi:hypothetical protein|nr:hypothetical protein [Gammaproteobacteria bacterium]